MIPAKSNTGFDEAYFVQIPEHGKLTLYEDMSTMSPV